jgi:hypothetical protein
VLCAHAGQAQPTAPIPRVNVMGQPITTQLPYTIAGCTNPPPPAQSGPCLTATWMTAATRVRAMGQPLLLQDSQSTCMPTGTPLMITVTQGRVRAI